MKKTKLAPVEVTESLKTSFRTRAGELDLSMHRLLQSLVEEASNCSLTELQKRLKNYL